MALCRSLVLFPLVWPSVRHERMMYFAALAPAGVRCLSMSQGSMPLML